MSYRQQLRHLTCRWFAPCVFILACVMQPVPAYAGERPPITLRAGPGEQHAVIATLPSARTMEFTVFEERGEWAKVRVDSSSEGTSPQEGWLRLDALLANASAGGLDLSPSSPGASYCRGN